MKRKIYLVLVFLSILGLAVTCKSDKATVQAPQSPALMPYEAMDYGSLIGMEGFSDSLLNTHFKLYQGYVKNTNLLLNKLKEYAASGRADSPEYAELKRRLGFEFNGMRLHEFYFGNLGGAGKLKTDNALYQALEVNFGSFDKWRQDFIATGAMRGIGWVVLYEDMITGRLINMWVNDHETGHLTGCNPLIVLDVFEHAYLTDYGLDRAKYIEAFFRHLDWGAVAERFGIEVAKVVEPVEEQPGEPGAKADQEVKSGSGQPAAGAGPEPAKAKSADHKDSAKGGEQPEHGSGEHPAHG